jgi:hypothetical protein
MAHRNQSGAGARMVSRSVGTASLFKEAAPVLLDGILPLIGQHYIGRRDPAHSVSPRQQRYLADRGAFTMLDHSAFLILERSDRVPYIRLPHGGPRVRIHLPPAGSLQTFDSCVHPLPRLETRSGTGRTRGIDGSNPAPSSGESTNFRFPVTSASRPPDAPRGLANGRKELVVKRESIGSSVRALPKRAIVIAPDPTVDNTV